MHFQWVIKTKFIFSCPSRMPIQLIHPYGDQQAGLSKGQVLLNRTAQCGLYPKAYYPETCCTCSRSYGCCRPRSGIWPLSRHQWMRRAWRYDSKPTWIPVSGFILEKKVVWHWWKSWPVSWIRMVAMPDLDAEYTTI